jgi:hypothetical protein
MAVAWIYLIGGSHRTRSNCGGFPGPSFEGLLNATTMGRKLPTMHGRIHSHGNQNNGQWLDARRVRLASQTPDSGRRHATKVSPLREEFYLQVF